MRSDTSKTAHRPAPGCPCRKLAGVTRNTSAYGMTPHLGTDADLFSSLSRMVAIEKQIDVATLGGELKYTIDDVAELTGISPDHIQVFGRWLGRPSIRTEDMRFAESDVETLKYAVAYAKRENLDFRTMGSTVRGIASALNRLAVREVESVIQKTAREQNLSDSEARLAVATSGLTHGEDLLPLIEHIWRRQYGSVLRRLTTSVITQRGIFGDDRDYPILRAVGFADLVDFTARTKNATAAEFAELIRDFSDTAWDIVHERGGRIVNFIGDAVFYVADSVQTGAEIGLALAKHGQTGICGQARVGMVWTRVLLSHGDVFGPGVNLASRICAMAEPGEMLIGPASTAQLLPNPKYLVVPQLPVEARGIGTIAVSRLRHADDPRNVLDQQQVTDDAVSFEFVDDVPSGARIGGDPKRQ